LAVAVKEREWNGSKERRAENRRGQEKNQGQ
jgi:hypothetical protein